MGKFLTTEQLAEHLQLRPDTIRQWARDGKIPRLKLSGKVIRFNVDEVDKALSQGRRTLQTPQRKILLGGKT
jgi:excisionase family DNA binding protein